MEVLSTRMEDGRGEYWALGREESGGEKVGKVPGIADSVGAQPKETVSCVRRMVIEAQVVIRSLLSICVEMPKSSPQEIYMTSFKDKSYKEGNEAKPQVEGSKDVAQQKMVAIINILEEDVEIEAPSIESIVVVSEFSEVFPSNLPSMPPDRDIDFCIDLEPGTRPISLHIIRLWQS
ncbi:hypothetical protein MTR67_018457 [Solanum verrucosum]|uniref:Uncharacterized protein n=1 Tax=Solanum verrucosum TaxID=315347 RepID=A0AAF0TLL5_SOLVR|nr:hypothetical protein MTR67_018457 [Solanum verrucosum]